MQAAEARGLGTSSAPALAGLAPLQRPSLGQSMPQSSAAGVATSSPRFSSLSNQARTSQAAARTSRDQTPTAQGKPCML